MLPISNPGRIRSHCNSLSGYERSWRPTTSRHRSDIFPLNLPSHELATVVFSVNVDVHVRVLPVVAANNSLDYDFPVLIKNHGTMMSAGARPDESAKQQYD